MKIEHLLIMVEDAAQQRLSPEQQDEMRRRLANPEPLVPENEMEAFFRQLTG